MSNSYRFDPDAGDGFSDRKAIKRARKAQKIVRRAQRKEETRLDGGDSESEQFDVLATIDDSWAR